MADIVDHDGFTMGSAFRFRYEMVFGDVLGTEFSFANLAGLSFIHGLGLFFIHAFILGCTTAYLLGQVPEAIN